MKPRNLLGISVILGILTVGCSSDSGTSSTSSGTTGKNATGATAQALTGAGSTFVNPAMSKWTYTYQQDHPGITINYQSVGSGAGIAQLKAGTVDFAASDVPMNDKDLADMPTPTVQVPVVAGCEVIAYNLPGVQNGLKLSGDVIADIFLGKITAWNDPRIVSLNPGMTLPATPISVAHRSDSSGTSYIFTDYLSSVSPAWKAGPGKSKSPNWPVGVGQKGNEGVAGVIQKTPGGIGYIELAYAVQTKATYGPIMNKSGKFVEPSVDSTAAAANALMDDLKKDIRTSIVNTPAADGYPICGFTYVLLSKQPKDAAKAKVVLDFLTWALGPGQDMAKELQYAPLPKSITDLDTAALAEVQAK